LLIISI